MKVIYEIYNVLLAAGCLSHILFENGLLRSEDNI